MHSLLLYGQQFALFLANGFFPSDDNPVQPKHCISWYPDLPGNIAIWDKYIHDLNETVHNTIWSARSG